MAEVLVTTSGSQISSNVLIAVISSVFILIILYPWIIAVTIVCFIVGFSGLEHLDKLLKQSITQGRFGPEVQARFKDYITLTGESDNKNVIKQVTADPLSNFIQEVDPGETDDSNQKENEPPLLGNHHPILVQSNSHHVVFGGNASFQNNLVIPARLSNSSRSSPEKNRTLLDSPKRSLSAASSRRVSEDIPGSTHSLVQPLTTTITGVSGIFPHLSPKRENTKTPSPSRSSTGASSPSPSISLNPDLVGALQPIDQDFRVDIFVDNAIGRLCKNIINYYISPSWAPYETRKQLRLSFKQLLKKFGERCCRKLLLPIKCAAGDQPVVSNAPLVKLTKDKLLPLAVHYIEKTLERGATSKATGEEPILSEESRKRIVLKIRKFCRQIFDKFLGKDDKKCKLWAELCVAVLADGVFVNVMELGRDKLPELLEDIVEKFKKSCNPVPGRERPSSRKSTIGSIGDEQDFIDPLSEDFVEAVQEQAPDLELVVNESNLEVENIEGQRVPFLLDSFLDPPFNLEKPDPIVSRWRPTIKDIVSETDLLYPLIQYMKHVGGQQSLAYLQGVLDEFPQDGDPYCRRILELEFLPGFCRSSLFLETMGLSRVEMAMEVGADPFSMTRRNSNGGHARSASYGGPSSNTLKEFWKIEQGVVDGLPLTESSQQNLSISSSSSEQSSAGVTGNSAAGAVTTTEEIQPSLAFKRRPHLEMYIAKFIKSTSKSWQQYYDPLADPQYEPAKRAGIDAKTYEDWDHPEVTSRVEIDSSIGEIYDSLCFSVTSLMRDCPIASPFVSGLVTFLKPYLMPLFDQQLDHNLTHLLSKDLLVTVVDLIADVYEPPSEDSVEADTNAPDVSGTDRKPSSSEGHPNQSDPMKLNGSNGTPSEDESHEYHNSFCTTCDPSFKSTVESFLKYVLERFMIKFLDLDYLVKCFSRNREYIFLFFVDLLDVLVTELVEN